MKIVVTGLGAHCALGENIKTLWNAIEQGKSGIAPINRFSVALNLLCTLLTDAHRTGVSHSGVALAPLVPLRVAQNMQRHRSGLPLQNLKITSKQE